MVFLIYWRNLACLLLWSAVIFLLSLAFLAQGQETKPEEGALREGALRYLLLPQEPIPNQPSTTLGKLDELSWSAFALKQQGGQAPQLLSLKLSDLRALGGWAAWFEQARKDAQQELIKLEPELFTSENGLLERVSYQVPFASSLLLTHEAIHQRWQEQLGKELLVLMDGEERLWLIAALSPNRQQQLEQWQINTPLSGQFFLLNEEGLRRGGQLQVSKPSSS